MNFFQTPGADQYAFPLYTMGDAIRLKEHVLKIKTFEAVDKNPSLIDEGALNFCVVGGGSTGVEVSGALAELIWAAGLKANPIVHSLGVELGHGGRIPVGPDLQVKDHPGVFAIGNIATMIDGGTGNHCQDSVPLLSRLAITSAKRSSFW